MSNTTTEEIKNLEQKLKENKILIKELKEENKNIQQNIFKEHNNNRLFLPDQFYDQIVTAEKVNFR